MKATLLIDTTSNQVIKVGLEINGKKHLMEQPLDKNKAQAVLPLIEKSLKKHNLTLNDLSDIQANPGPGSFTGIRVGLTVANTLATLLKIPINNQSIGKLEEPQYT
jgi:tRNA threonylcarbamoyladenosine biosynthesis protein TsaB